MKLELGFYFQIKQHDFKRIIIQIAIAKIFWIMRQQNKTLAIDVLFSSL